MSKLIATSEIGDFLDAGRFFDFANSFNPLHAYLLGQFSYLLEYGPLNVTSLSATEIISSGTAPDGSFFEVTVEGRGISPVSSFADLLAAFDNGLANGSSSKVTVEGSKSPAAPVDILVIDISPAGYTMTLFGDYPVDFGDVLASMFEIVDAIDNGAPVDFSNLAGYSIDQLKIFNADGEVILETDGPLGDSATLEFHVTKIEGVNVVNLILGDNNSNSEWPNPSVPGDFLNGTNGKDHMFGLAGNHGLFGGKGNDFLFGGTGGDILDGGRGNDFLNPGSNIGQGDSVYGSRGDDIIIYSDSGDDGYQVLGYSGLKRGIKMEINGKANTGEITKNGGLGTDTLIDVAVPIKAGGVVS